MEGENLVMTLLEGLTRAIHEIGHTMATQSHEFQSMMLEQAQRQHSSREFKIEGASMPTFHGRPDESVDEFIFEAKLFMSGKNIDYNRADNQGRVVAMLASNLRSGAASWYHSRIMVECNPIETIGEFHQALTREFIPPDQQQRLRAALRTCRQTGHADDYVARFRKRIAQVREMSQLDRVNRCETLTDAIAAAKAYERAHFGGEKPPRRSRLAQESGPEPMDLLYAGVTKPTKKMCRQQNLCFYCREGGHRISQCPKRGQKQGNDSGRRIIIKPTVLVRPDEAKQTLVTARNFEGQACSLWCAEYPVVVAMDGHVCSVPVVEWPLEQPFDGILGRSWLTVANPSIEWASGKISFTKYDPYRKQEIDGKIGIWAFAEPYEAQRSSKLRAKCTVVLRNVETVDREAYKAVLIYDIIPAIKAKWPASGKKRTIWIQHDSAKPHVPVNDPDVIAAGTSGGWDIRMRCQPADSPDLNVLDLGYFRSIQSLQYQRECRGVQELIDDVGETFVEMQSSTLNKIFLTLQAVMEQILLADGGKAFKIPHKGKDSLAKKGELPVSFPCSQEAAVRGETFRDPITGVLPSKIQWTEVPRIPIPRIDELFDRLGGAQVFSLIDLASGYHQMKMAPESRQYTAFRAGSEIYQWVVAPMGLAGMPGTWSRLMRRIFETSELAAFVVVYLDDICVFSRNMETHVEHLRRVFSILRAEKLYARPSKCNFVQPEIRFLGHIISGAGVRVDPDKTAALANWPTPSNVMDVQRFLGLAGYYRRFVNGFAALVLPLSNLVKASQGWRWTAEEEVAFNAIKTKLLSSPILRLPDTSVPFHVTTDASNTCIGGVLSQVVDGFDHPVSFYSQKLSETESKWPAHEHELYAIKQSDASTSSRYELREGLLCVKSTDAVPVLRVPQVDAVLLRILHDFHDASIVSHPGVRRTFVAIRQYFWWPSMRDHIAQYIGTCEACVHHKTGSWRRNGLLQSLPSVAENAIVDEHVQKMLQEGVIEMGNGPWGFPVVLVRKKDGAVRFCVDYRALNHVTNKNSHLVRYLLFLVDSGRLRAANLYFLIKGHIKNNCDRGFALIKKAYAKTDVYTLAQVDLMIKNSTSTNTSVCLENTSDVFFDWKAVLTPVYRDVKNIQRYQLFNNSSSNPGVVSKPAKTRKAKRT
ncbi:hypothetical protein ATCC90586_008852 [Pythium insidiosum]|nr:hypothetical protein ATCC90586_008852 [Pythium insidiosum]